MGYVPGSLGEFAVDSVLNKVCGKCGESKAKEDFIGLKKGLCRYCRDCRKVSNNLIELRRLGWYSSVKGKESRRSSVAKYKIKNPLKTQAGYAIQYARRRGKIIAGKCGSFSNKDGRRHFEGLCNGYIEAHHYLGYAKKDRLRVQWVCARHHRTSV